MPESKALADIQRNLANLQVKAQEQQQIASAKQNALLEQGVNNAVTKGIQDFQAEQQQAAEQQQQADGQAAAARKPPPPPKPIKLPFQNIDRAAEPGAAGALTPQAIQSAVQGGAAVQSAGGAAPQGGGTTPTGLGAQLQAAGEDVAATPVAGAPAANLEQVPEAPGGLQAFGEMILFGGTRRSQAQQRNERALANEAAQLANANVPLEGKLQKLTALTGAANAQVAMSHANRADQLLSLKRGQARVKLAGDSQKFVNEALGDAADEFSAATTPFIAVGNVEGAINAAFEAGAPERMAELADRSRRIDDLEEREKSAGVMLLGQRVARGETIAAAELQSGQPFHAGKARAKADGTSGAVTSKEFKENRELNRRGYAASHAFDLVTPKQTTDIGLKLFDRSQKGLKTAGGDIIPMSNSQLQMELGPLSKNTVANNNSYTSVSKIETDAAGDNGWRPNSLNFDETQGHINTLAKFSLSADPEASPQEVLKAIGKDKKGRAAVKFLKNATGLPPSFFLTGQLTNAEQDDLIARLIDNPNRPVITQMLRDWRLQNVHNDALTAVREQQAEFFSPEKKEERRLAAEREANRVQVNIEAQQNLARSLGGSGARSLKTTP